MMTKDPVHTANKNQHAGISQNTFMHYPLACKYNTNKGSSLTSNLLLTQTKALTPQESGLLNEVFLDMYRIC